MTSQPAMIEVLKTNVQEQKHADMLIDLIQKAFAGHQANFDLADCDRILRVKSVSGQLETLLIVKLLASFGFEAEILPDQVETSHKEHVPFL